MLDLSYAEEQLGRLPKKERVRLRRGRLSGGLWRILVEQNLDPSPDREQVYQLLLRAVALCGQGSNEQGSDNFGAVLQTAGYSQVRLERLLEAQDLLDEARKAILFLEAKGVAPDWSQLQNYLIYQNDRARRSIARSYFRSQYSDSTDNE